jgi:tetratricopeptide (TPR) repeat protein
MPHQRMHFQRFTAADPQELVVHIESARRTLVDAKARDQMSEYLDIAASLGSMLTTARQEEEARSLLLQSLALSRERGTPEQSGWLLLYLATANQYLGAHPEVNEQFNEALSLAKSSQSERLEHFVLHHWGRFLVEEGEIAQARGCFTRALELREKSNDPKQSSSRRALEALSKLASERDA